MTTGTLSEPRDNERSPAPCSLPPPPNYLLPTMSQCVNVQIALADLAGAVARNQLLVDLLTRTYAADQREQFALALPALLPFNPSPDLEDSLPATRYFLSS